MADRITVLRDGRTVGTADTASSTKPRVVSWMVGRTVDTLFPPPRPVAGRGGAGRQTSHGGGSACATPRPARRDGRSDAARTPAAGRRCQLQRSGGRGAGDRRPDRRRAHRVVDDAVRRGTRTAVGDGHGGRRAGDDSQPGGGDGARSRAARRGSGAARAVPGSVDHRESGAGRPPHDFPWPHHVARPGTGRGRAHRS